MVMKNEHIRAMALDSAVQFVAGTGRGGKWEEYEVLELAEYFREYIQYGAGIKSAGGE